MKLGTAERYLEACRSPVLDEARRIIRQWTSGDEHAYGLMVDYLERRGKGLRPALCIAVCRSLGGTLEEVLPSAAVVELFHNAFLIHDDIEDASLERRGAPALHQTHGTPIALNVGDGLLALAQRPLLENTERIGLGRALRVLEIVSRMVTESFEGQAMELRWVSSGAWALTDGDYEAMVLKKTGWYSFIAPALIGATVAQADPERERLLTSFMTSMGWAFQIQDDILNLTEDQHGYGKEFDGDLWEGKRTLILLHALREANDEEREKALTALSLPRPSTAPGHEGFVPLVDEMVEAQIVTEDTAATMRVWLRQRSNGATTKQPADVAMLRALIERYDGLGHARAVAARHAQDAKDAWGRLASQLPECADTAFLADLIEYVVHRRC